MAQKALVIVSRKGELLEVVLRRMVSNDLLGGKEGFVGGPGVGKAIQIIYKMNFIKDSFQRF